MEKIEDLTYIPADDMEWKLDAGMDNIKIELLESLLEESSSKVNIILMHQPPPLSGWAHHSFKLNGKKFLELVQRFNSRIAYVCSGHMHGYGEQSSYGVKFIVSGGAGSKFRPYSYDKGMIHKYNYVLFEVDGPVIKDTVYFVD